VGLEPPKQVQAKVRPLGEGERYEILDLKLGLKDAKPERPDACEGLRPREIPGMVTDDGIIIEEVLAVWRPRFVACDREGNVRYADAFILGKELLVPIDDELVRKGAICLASKAEPYSSELELMREILEFMGRYADVDPVYMKLAAIYVLTSWVCDKCPALPELNLRGAPESGKSRFGEVLRQLSYRGMDASGASSYASLYRFGEVWGGTMVIDEADLGRSDEASDIVKYLNLRYERGKCLWRWDQEAMEPRVFVAYGPTVLITRKPLWDAALSSRCIVIQMEETERDDIPLNLPPEFYAQAQELKNKLLTFRLCNYHRFEVDHHHRFKGLGHRMNQVLQPMASLARLISPDLYAFIEGIADDLNERVVEERSHSEEGFVVRAIMELKLEGKEAITSSDISDWIRDQLGYEINSKRVGWRLTSLGIKRRKLGKERFRAVEIEPRKLDRLVLKYVPRDERERWFEYRRQLKLQEFEGQASGELVAIRPLVDMPEVVGEDAKPYGPFKQGVVAHVPLGLAETMIRLKQAERAGVGEVGEASELGEDTLPLSGPLENIALKMPGRPAGAVSIIRDLIRQLAPKRGDLVDKRRLKELAERREIPAELVDRVLEREARDGRIIDRGARIEPIH
jgi:hypothetical protein